MADDLAQTLAQARESAAQSRGVEAGLGTAMVVGFEGASEKEGTTRVYLTPDCDTAYVEFPEVATIHAQELPAETTRGFGGKSFFLPHGQKCVFHIAAPVNAADVDAFALKDNLAAGGAVAVGPDGTERWVGTAVGIGTTAWNVAGQLGLQEPIKQGVSTAINKVGSWFKSLF